MFNSTKQLLVLATTSGILAGVLYLWWGRLIAGTFAQCVGDTPAAGIDCSHNLQIYAAAVLAVITLALLLTAVVRAARPAQRRAA